MDNVHSPDSLLGTTSIALDSLLCTELLLLILRGRINKVPSLPKGALLDWYLVTVDGIWVKWTYGYVQETSLR